MRGIRRPDVESYNEMSGHGLLVRETLMNSSLPWRRLAKAKFFPAHLLIIFILIPYCVKAAEPSSRDLNSGWQFRAVGNCGRYG